MNWRARLRATAQRRSYADVAVAVVVYAVTLLTTAGGAAGGALDPLAIAIAALACGALALRRRYPFPVFVVSAIAAEAYLIRFQGHAGSMVLAAPLIALYTVAEAAPRRRALLIGVLAVLAFAGAHELFRPTAWLGAENLALAALGALAVAAGDAARNHRAYLAEVEARARRAEADREAEATRRVTDERLRIARDLHDDVGHQLALIYVQAGVAAHLLDTSPSQSHQALAHVRTASKTALGTLRDTIGLLRQTGDQTTPADPVAGLAGVAGLLAGFRHSGLDIALHIGGRVQPVAVAADLTAYRIIQESLTNVCMHAGPTTVDLQLTYRPDTLQIVIDNESPARLPPPGQATGDYGGRHGLVGMRERVTALGGSLSTGLRPGGGYRVTAVLPLAAGSRP